MPEVPAEWYRDNVYSPQDAAAVFGITQATLGKWARRGRIGYFRTPSGQRRYPESEIRRIVNGIPAPDIVRELAEQDQAEWTRKWRDEGWHNNEYTLRAFEMAEADRAQKAAKEQGEKEQ